MPRAGHSEHIGSNTHTGKPQDFAGSSIEGAKATNDEEEDDDMDEKRLAAIIAAIRTLKPEDFTKAGPPNMTALRAAVPDVTAEERDTAWAKIEEETATKASPPPAAEPAAKPTQKAAVTGEDVIKNLRAQGHKI
jgi:hypothetical protein